jgi:hypothetical protein
MRGSTPTITTVDRAGLRQCSGGEADFSAALKTDRENRGRILCDFGDNSCDSGNSYFDEADMNS